MILNHGSLATSATFADEIEKEEWKIYADGNTGRYLPREENKKVNTHFKGLTLG